MVIRIMLMVPIYAISSLISLFSLNAAFFIDVVRDIYEVRAQLCHSNSTWLTSLIHPLGIRYLLLL